MTFEQKRGKELDGCISHTFVTQQNTRCKLLMKERGLFCHTSLEVHSPQVGQVPLVSCVADGSVGAFVKK